MRIRPKLLTAFVGVSMFVPLLGGAALTRMQSLKTNVVELSGNTLDELVDIRELKDFQRQQQVALYQFHIAGNDEAETTFRRYQRSFEVLAGDIENDLKDSPSPAQRVAIQRLSDAHRRFNDAAENLVAARETTNRAQVDFRTQSEGINADLAKIPARYGATAGSSGAAALAVSPQQRSQLTDVLLSAEGMAGSSARAQAAVREYAANPNDQAKQQYQVAVSQFDAWAKQGLSTGSGEDQDLVRKAQQRFAELDSQAKSLMQAADNSKQALKRLDDTAAVITGTLDLNAGFTLDGARTLQTTSVATVSNATVAMAVLTVCGFLFATGLGFWFAGRITKPIRQLHDVAERVSMGQMDDVELNITSKDEIGDLAGAFQRMIASLRIARMRSRSAGGDQRAA